MAQDTQVSAAARNAMLDALTALLNAGGAGTIEIYDGTKPAGPGTAITSQTKLVTLTLSSTSFAAASGGSAAANTIAAGTAVATGTASWARWKSGAGTAVFDCTVGTSGADINLGTTSIASGASVGLSGYTLTHPA